MQFKEPRESAKRPLGQGWQVVWQTKSWHVKQELYCWDQFYQTCRIFSRLLTLNNPRYFLDFDCNIYQQKKSESQHSFHRFTVWVLLLSICTTREIWESTKRPPFYSNDVLVHMQLHTWYCPGWHCWHVVDPVEAAIDPAPQATHADWPANIWYVSGRHSLQNPCPWTSM